MTIAVAWSEGIEDAWADVATFVPKLLGFLAILLIGWFVAKGISRAADAALERTGFDEAVRRGGIASAMERSPYDASTLLSRVVFYTLVLVVLQLAFAVFGENPVSDLLRSVVAYLPRVAVAIVLVVVAAAIGAAVRSTVESSLGGLSYGRPLAVAAGAAVVVFGVFAALDTLQIAPTIVRITFTALMALVVGSGIVAIGGGGIAPMRRYWERALDRLEDEAPRMREQARHREVLDLPREERRREEARGTVQQRAAERRSGP